MRTASRRGAARFRELPHKGGGGRRPRSSAVRPPGLNASTHTRTHRRQRLIKVASLLLLCVCIYANERRFKHALACFLDTRIFFLFYFPPLLPSPLSVSLHLFVEELQWGCACAEEDVEGLGFEVGKPTQRPYYSSSADNG